MQFGVLVAALLVQSARGLGKDPTIDRAAVGSLKHHPPRRDDAAVGLVAYCVR
jgi:hypothetical protein